jgi:integrase
VVNGVIERNPIKAVYIPKHERKNGEAFTPDQEKTFVSQIKGSKYENYYLKMLYSGVRPSEVFEIAEDVDEDNELLWNHRYWGHVRLDDIQLVNKNAHK